jgi:hypothetical protein
MAAEHPGIGPGAVTVPPICACPLDGTHADMLHRISILDRTFTPVHLRL